MSGSETNATRFAQHNALMARVGDLLRKSGRIAPFASMRPMREPRIGAAPEPFSRKEVERFLSREATGWDQRVRDAIAVPERLLVARESGYVLYSQDAGFGIAKACRDFAFARESTGISGYGIAIDGSRIDSVYFVLADPSRRILVRELLACRHDQNDFEWQAVAASIESAVRFSKNTPPSGVVIHNGRYPYLAE